MTDCNIPNRTIFCDDNIDVLRGINSECIDLIYLDPPFNKNKKFTAPIGSSAEGAEFKDIFREEDVKSEWLITIREDHPELYHYLNGIRGVGNPYNFAYLAYMAIRLIECQRILKNTGSIYLHCDPTMSHYLKSLMDCVFGEKNFRNEIVWCYKGGGKGLKDFARKHDVILRYCQGRDFVFNENLIRVPYEGTGKNRKDASMWGSRRKGSDNSSYKPNPLGKIPEDWWVIPQLNSNDPERVGYPTQKPIKLLERIVNASSNEGDIVLDPFCGCATTCVAAEHLNRQWIGIDISIKAYELVQGRLVKDVANPGNILQFRNRIHLKTDPPKRTDLDVDYREQKFVYVISHPGYPGEYKVGIAKNVQTRLVAYQTADPDRAYKIEYKLETPYFRELERHIHDVFPNKHEWVTAELDEIVKAIKAYQPDE